MENLPKDTPILIKKDDKKEIKTIGQLYQDEKIEYIKGRKRYKNIEEEINIYRSNGWKQIKRIIKERNSNNEELILLQTNRKIIITTAQGKF